MIGVMERRPLVGRGEEFARASAALRDGTGVFVSGEAGSGKTALVTAALTGLEVRAGQCFRSLSWTPGIALQQALGRPVPAGDAGWAAQAVATACRDCVLRLDDLQWADPLTLEVVGLLPLTTRLAVTVRTGEPGTQAALAALEARGLLELVLQPLAPADAVELARSRFPQLSLAEAQRLAARCGGNPLLIEELGGEPEVGAGLRRSLTRRLRRLGGAAWQGFAMLAIAGEPLPVSWSPDIAALQHAGLVLVDSEVVRPRHPLLAEMMALELDDGDAQDRAAFELEFADRAEASGRLALAARCSAAAGDHARAVRIALAAAEGSESPGERAGLLHLAASSAAPGQADELARRAVEELVTAGDYAQAATLIDRVSTTETAAWLSLVGRVRWQLGDDDAAIESFERGLALAEPGTRDAVLLRAEYARALAIAKGAVHTALPLAHAALAEAAALGVEQARTLAVLGTLEHFAGVPESIEHLTRAVELAARDGDLMVEFTSANNLIAAHESAGEERPASALALRFAARAEQLHMWNWQQQMRAMAMNAQMNVGHYDDVLADVTTLLAGALERRTREQLEVTLGIALTDTGRCEEAIDRMTTGLQWCAPDFYGRGSLLWVRSEARLWAGDLDGAIEDASAALEFTPEGGIRLFGLLTICHGRMRLDQPIAAQVWPEPHVTLLAGAPAELDGLRARSVGDMATAARCFADAAARWAGQHRRAEMRCRWLAADSSMDTAAARVELLALEQELAGLGWHPLLGQVRRSLRARGVRSAAPRGRAGELTAREREVLDLVAQGLSTDAVAARLGLAPSTVAAQIASARARLGASTRWQAAKGG